MINQSSELWLFFNFRVYYYSSCPSQVSTPHAIYQPSSSTCKLNVTHILCNRMIVQNLIIDCAICWIKYCIINLLLGIWVTLHIHLVFSVGTQNFTVLNKMAGCCCFSVCRDECARQRFRIVGGRILVASVCFLHPCVCVCVGGGVCIYDPALFLLHCHLCDTNALVVFVPNSVR